MISIKAIDKKLEQIKQASLNNDYEKAHSLEDDLFVTVLESIAKLSMDEKAKAAASRALDSLHFKFERYCA